MVRRVLNRPTHPTPGLTAGGFFMPMNPDPRSPSAPILTGAIPQTVLQIRTALANYDPPKPKADFTPAEGAIYRG